MENKEEKDKSVCTAEAVANLIQKPPRHRWRRDES